VEAETGVLFDRSSTWRNYEPLVALLQQFLFGEITLIVLGDREKLALKVGA
jgi:hypothetical protein